MCRRRGSALLDKNQRLRLCARRDLRRLFTTGQAIPTRDRDDELGTAFGSCGKRGESGECWKTGVVGGDRIFWREMAVAGSVFVRSWTPMEPDVVFLRWGCPGIGRLRSYHRTRNRAAALHKTVEGIDPFRARVLQRVKSCGHPYGHIPGLHQPMNPSANISPEVCIVGGAGHVGVPLALVIANCGITTRIFDINTTAMQAMAAGKMPFMEQGGEPMLMNALKSGKLSFSSDLASIVGVPYIVLTIGTPIDEFHNPDLSILTRCLDGLMPFLGNEQTLILRSTVAPGTTNFIDGYLRRNKKKTKLAFCPERVVQGKGIEEIQTLPQLVSGTTPEALQKACVFFSRIAPQVVEMSPIEAEFAKLICNAFRYIQFAATNQLYMMVENAGLNYRNLLAKMTVGYPRMGSIPSPGFAAGPCLMKDTMQLFAFQRQNFTLGQMAMTINEGLPNFIVGNLTRKFALSRISVGILGMAFKAESDDIRDSLSFKLGKLLRFEGAGVYYSDEYVQDPAFVNKEELLRRSDVIIVGVPHAAYRNLSIPDDKEVIDLWGILSSQQNP